MLTTRGYGAALNHSQQRLRQAYAWSGGEKHKVVDRYDRGPRRRGEGARRQLLAVRLDGLGKN